MAPEREVKVTNRGKVFWPRTGFTKGQLVDYYRSVAAAMVPHLEARPITLRRWPDGVDGQTFFQKNAPRYRPDWMGTVTLGDVDYLRIDEAAALVWAANSAAIEIHPGLARAPALDHHLDHREGQQAEKGAHRLGSERPLPDHRRGLLGAGP